MQGANSTLQLDAWTTEFGRKYTDRNPQSSEEMDKALSRCFGMPKSALFRQFLPPDRLSSGRVLEVGCNVGVQLDILRSVCPGAEMYGIDPQKYALMKARELYPDFNLVRGTAFDLPFKDGYFDLVMTNTVLIHIHPDHVNQALSEIHRCSRRFIFLHEYFAEQPCETTYRGKIGLLWKMNFMQRYLDQFPDLRCVEVRYFHYRDADSELQLTDQVCLLEKRLAS